MSQSVESGREQLPAAKQAIDPPGTRAPEQPHDRDRDEGADERPEQGRQNDKQSGFADPVPLQDSPASFREPDPDEAKGQGVGRAGRQAQVPGENVPANGGEKRGG